MTFIEITALRRMEDALRSKEAMLELAERAANAGVWELDARARLRMSEQCHRLYGIATSPSPLEAAAWTANVVSEERGPLLDSIASALRGGTNGGLDVEVRVRHPELGDRSLWMLGRKTDAASEIAGITLDVTAARVARRALEEADRRKNEFIATLAHELRNPLTPLAISLDILKLGGSDPAQVEIARSLMERQVSQLRRLVDDLLDLSRIQTGRLELEVQPGLSLREVIDYALEAAQPLIDELEHTLDVRVPEGLRLDGDPLRLGQVFVNLLMNAAKYTEPGGTITVVAALEGNNVRVSIRDTGIGIPAEALPKVFDVFVQAEPITTRSRGGLGIGLSLVKQLVLLHGGTIVAESEGEGRGSCFTVTLRLSTPE